MSNEIKPEWDWKLNWPKCFYWQCGKDSIDEHWHIDGFRFCKKHFELIQQEFQVILFDAINPHRKINPECKNKEWHYKTICTLGSCGGCSCTYCGLRLQDCDGEHSE